MELAGSHLRVDPELIGVVDVCWLLLNLVGGGRGLRVEELTAHTIGTVEVLMKLFTLLGLVVLGHVLLPLQFVFTMGERALNIK